MVQSRGDMPTLRSNPACAYSPPPMIAPLLLSLLACVAPLQGSGSTPAVTPERVRVGVVSNPPYTIVGAEGQLTGFLPRIWRDACAFGNLEPVMTVVSAVDGLELVRAGDIDVLLDGVELSPESLGSHRFTVPLEQRSLRAIVRPEDAVNYRGLIRAIWHSDLGALMAIATVLGVAAALIMVAAERKHRRSYFTERTPQESVEHGLWWSIVTFCTVGYGDVVPVTRGGRLLAAVWMLLSVLLVALMGSVVAAEFTVSKLRPSLGSVAAVRGKSIVVVDGSDKPRLEAMGAIVSLAPTFDAAAEGVRKGTYDAAFLSDLEIALSRSVLGDGGLQVLPGRLPDYFVGLILSPQVSRELEQRINMGLVAAIREAEWHPAMGVGETVLRLETQ